MKYLWGKTGYAFVDVWTIAHLAFWIFIGSCLWAAKINRQWALAGCLIVAYAWEVFERFAERKWPNIWLSPESWWNAWISDPLTCFVGVLFIWYALDHWRF